MGFMRRKSAAAIDAEEVRTRRRLSKPMTRSPTSSHSPPSRHSPKSISQSNSVVSSQISIGTPLRATSKRNSIVDSTSQVFEAYNDKPKAVLHSIPRKAVASLVMQFETAASTSQTSLHSPAAPQRPLSRTYGSRRLPEIQQPEQPQHVHSISSKEQLSLHKRSLMSLQSSSASLEHLVDSYAIPRRRESRYRPGDATRKASLEEEGMKARISKEVVPQSNTDNLPSNARPGQETEIVPEQWTPPNPPFDRTETPSSLDFKAIGGLKLGSLHVVNGRASPVLSELSRHLISRQLRDVSSEYADSIYSKDAVGDTWEDADLDEAEDTETEEPHTPTRTTVEANTRNFSTPTGPVNALEPSRTSDVYTPIQSPDRTSIMAQSYMDELQRSPFSIASDSTFSSESVIRHQTEDQAGEQIPGHETHSDGATTEESFPAKNDSRSVSLESGNPSIESKLSEPETTATFETRTEAFSSALEHQAPVFQPPPSPERGISPSSFRPESVARLSSKVDSGYNSGTSMLSLSLKEAKHETQEELLRADSTPIAYVPATKEKSSQIASPKKEHSPMRLGRFFPMRPVMRKSPATMPVVPTIGNIRPEPTGTVNATTAKLKVNEHPKKTKEQDVKMQKKLHKTRPQSRARESKEIVVQRLPSLESTLDIPAVSDTAKANLHLRSQQVPELEKTFTSQHHITSQPSMTNLTVPNADIRFPSPLPNSDDEEESSRNKKKDRDRSKSRQRSKSRRRSFLDYFRSDKDTERREHEKYQDESSLVIADFGDVIASLGANPYDIAHSRPQSADPSARKHIASHASAFRSDTGSRDATIRKDTAPRTSPHDISVNRPKQRLSMNDEEASEFARMRSLSLHGHDHKHERKPASEQSGSSQAKHIRVPLVEAEIPPLPPLPDKEELRRISQRHSLQSSYITTPNQVQKFWEQSSSPDLPPDDSPAPPPPTHSPRPSFVDHGYEEEYAVEEEMELAPPPPSHSPVPKSLNAPFPPSRSPKPMNIELERDSDSPWDAQARAWRERRKSASEALISHRQSLDLRGGDHSSEQDCAIEHEHEQDHEQDYPIIPPRQTERYEWSQYASNHWEPEPDDYGHFDHGLHMQRSQTWDSNPHPSYEHEFEYAHYSQSSFQSRNKRHNTWDEGPEYGSTHNSSRLSQRELHGSRQSDRNSRISTDSRQSFYSHHNHPIDRPFDPPPRLSEDSEDGHGSRNQYYTPHASPIRGRERHRQQQEYGAYNGYERDYDPHPYGYDQRRPIYDDGYNGNYSYALAEGHRPRQQPHYRPPTRSPQPSTTRNSFVPLSPIQNPPRSSSRHSYRSLRSNGSAVSLAEELHPDVDKRPSLAPDFGRYSGGLSYGYEGRDKGFGGSAGTRSVSGKADAMFKGTVLRETHGVDLGDVPVIGIVKKIK